LFRSGGIVLSGLGFSAAERWRKAARMRCQLARNGKNGRRADLKPCLALVAQAGHEDNVSGLIEAVSGYITTIAKGDHQFAKTSLVSQDTANLRVGSQTQQMSINCVRCLVGSARIPYREEMTTTVDTQQRAP